MLMDLELLLERWNVPVHGVLHLGAHLAEEAEVYHRLGVGPVWWVEANPKVQAKIQRVLDPYPDQHLIEALIWDTDDSTPRPFNITNYDGMSSSVLEFGTHPEFSPDTKYVDTVQLPTRSVDSLVAEHGIEATLLNMDLQGAEGWAIRGAQDFLGDQVTAIMAEVNKAEVYKGCTQVGEFDRLIARRDFQRVETSWVGDQGWGDCWAVKVPE